MKIGKILLKSLKFDSAIIILNRPLSTTISEANKNENYNISHKAPVLPKKLRSTGEPLDFIDYQKVVCSGGNGGDGVISFLREKNLEFCQGKCCHGKNGGHLYMDVPLNTLIKRPSEDELRPVKESIWELTRDGEMFIAARGGAGGHGNAFYLSVRTNMTRKPLKAEEGGRGEEVSYDIEMRVMATAGFVGFPNVGKSTLLRAISRAKPKVAAYPFTTLKPSVGMVEYSDYFQVAGLVKGAHRNEGLGFSFLRHILRCECIIFVIDCSQKEMKNQWLSLRRELELYDADLMKKETAIVFNKIDTVNNKKEFEKEVAKMFGGERLFFISGKYRLDLEPLLMYLRERHERFLLERKALLKKEEEQMML
uniref:OBG-type G domain-containing protein n=1 Tax=Meloidogyne hapla TaxID=6305 RepID=A0A1I8BNS3_MELHA